MNTNSNAHREILWNVNYPITEVIMYSFFALALIIGVAGIMRRVELWSGGRPAPEHSGNYLHRIKDLVWNALLQRSVNREQEIALAHFLIYVGMLALVFATTMVALDHDLGIPIFRGPYYLSVSLIADLFGLAVIVGCGLAAYRRYFQAPDRLHSNTADAFLLAIIAFLCVQGFLLEGLRIHATNDPWGPQSPIGYLIAQFFWALPHEAARLFHMLLWWLHAVTAFAFIALIPYSKLFHIVVSSANLFFRSSSRPRGALASPGDIEQMIEEGEDFSIGLGTIKDYSWKHLLDLDACTSCGRCQNLCPAYNSGKVLSPKWMVLDTRNHALALHADGKLSSSPDPLGLKEFDSKLIKHYLRSSSGLEPTEDGGYTYAEDMTRAANSLVQSDAALSIGAAADDRIAGGVLDPDVFWACNTCYACVDACPVGINHVDLIVENRRNMVLMEGEVPAEAAGTLKALETRGNPFGAPEDRGNWTEGLDVKVLQEGDTVDYLYWVGCVSAYDPRKQKIAQSLVKIMNSAGLSFGILGTKERCCGDPARRLGEENLYQTLAKQNLELMKTLTFSSVVANCPHCFNTLKNEYPQLGKIGSSDQDVEVIHHSQLIEQLIDSGAISVSDFEGTATFHDPCYLGRANAEYNAPRNTLRSSPRLNILEMENTRERSMCCGAGGGHFWMDMKVGERVNVLRVEQAAETGADTVATACPYCMQMLEDGVKLTDREDSLEIKDIAEFIADNLEAISK